LFFPPRSSSQVPMKPIPLGIAIPESAGQADRLLRVAFYLSLQVLVDSTAQDDSGLKVGGAEAEGVGGRVGALLDDCFVGLEPFR
jgi:hypothetical protein